MTTMELRQSLLREIASIMDSDELTRKALDYVRKLKSKKTIQIEEDSDELILANMKEAFKELKEIKAGRGKTWPIEEVLNELCACRYRGRRYLPFDYV